MRTKLCYGNLLNELTEIRKYCFITKSNLEGLYLFIILNEIDLFILNGLVSEKTTDNLVYP